MKLLLVANWKNHPSTLQEANKLITDLARKAKIYKKLQTFVAPPAVFIESVSKKVSKIGLLASQDIADVSTGTETGALTPDILRSFGVKLSIIGHSERRKRGETDDMVAKKVGVALKSGIVPLVCIGEEVHDAEGNYFQFLEEQIKASLQGVKKSEASKVVIAYEPVWAIGALEAIQPQELNQTVIFIRKVLTEMFGRRIADKVSILYGGSVDSDNAGALIAGSGIQGFLVGRASLSYKDFSEIALALV